MGFQRRHKTLPQRDDGPKRAQGHANGKNNGSKLTPAASAVFGEWYSINGGSASPEDGEVMAARGLPFGDYWVAGDFVLKLQKPAFRGPLHALLTGSGEARKTKLSKRSKGWVAIRTTGAAGRI